jgi:ABC-type nickel/cobalt efflux system permease component RcnA
VHWLDVFRHDNAFTWAWYTWIGNVSAGIIITFALSFFVQPIRKRYEKFLEKHVVSPIHEKMEKHHQEHMTSAQTHHDEMMQQAERHHRALKNHISRNSKIVE